MPYVDGYVITLPKKSVPAYVKMARAAMKIWMDHGALEFRECVGDDIRTNSPHCGSFKQLARLKPTETCFFSWVVYKSKAHRNAVNKKIMADPRMAKLMEGVKMPFDPKRMAYGGFVEKVRG